MKISHILTILTAFFALVSATRADSLAMRNGDHLSGTIVTSDAKNLTLKTDYAGEIKISWAAVKEASSDKSLYVVASGDKTVNGTISSDGTNLIVHTASSGGGSSASRTGRRCALGRSASGVRKEPAPVSD